MGGRSSQTSRVYRRGRGPAQPETRGVLESAAREHLLLSSRAARSEPGAEIRARYAARSVGSRRIRTRLDWPLHRHRRAGAHARYRLGPVCGGAPRGDVRLRAVVLDQRPVPLRRLPELREHRHEHPLHRVAHGRRRAAYQPSRLSAQPEVQLPPRRNRSRLAAHQADDVVEAGPPLQDDRTGTRDDRTGTRADGYTGLIVFVPYTEGRHMRKHGALFLLVLLISIPCAAASGALSQAAASRPVSGTVVDLTGSAVPSAQVSIEGSNVFTDDRGRFSIAVDRAEVQLLVRAAGFAPSSVTARAGESVRVILQPAGIAETLTVTAGRSSDRIADTASAVTVIGSDALLTTGASTPDDALRSVPGFSLFRRSSSRDRKS